MSVIWSWSKEHGIQLAAGGLLLLLVAGTWATLGVHTRQRAQIARETEQLTRAAERTRQDHRAEILRRAIYAGHLSRTGQRNLPFVEIGPVFGDLAPHERDHLLSTVLAYYRSMDLTVRTMIILGPDGVRIGEYSPLWNGLKVDPRPQNMGTKTGTNRVVIREISRH